MNAKNRLLELLAKRGLSMRCAVFTETQSRPGAAWDATVVVTLPGRAPVTGEGQGWTKSQAHVGAAAEALANLAALEAEVPGDWTGVYEDAQAGDALLKLAAYLSPDLISAEARSLWLQVHESDARLAQVFDRWYDEGVVELAPFGRGLGQKNKATVVEALLWRRFGARVLGSEAGEALRELRRAMGD